MYSFWIVNSENYDFWIVISQNPDRYLGPTQTTFEPLSHSKEKKEKAMYQLYQY